MKRAGKIRYCLNVYECSESLSKRDRDKIEERPRGVNVRTRETVCKPFRIREQRSSLVWYNGCKGILVIKLFFVFVALVYNGGAKAFSHLIENRYECMFEVSKPCRPPRAHYYLLLYYRKDQSANRTLWST